MRKRIVPLVIVLIPVAVVGTYMVNFLRQETIVLNSEVRAEAPGSFIKLEHGLVHYRLIGPDTANLIVFIHGGGITGCEVWDKTIPTFANRGYRILCYDLYGRGYSDRPDVAQSPPLFCAQLNELLDKLHLEGPFDMVALSMGAIIALDFVHLNGDRVKKLVLIDPAASGNYRPSPLLRIPLVSDYLMTVYWYPRAVENQRKEFVDMDLFDSYSNRLTYFKTFKGYKHTNYSTWMHMLNQSKLELVREIPQHASMLIYGGNDPYFDEAQAGAYRSRCPGIEVHEVPATGHMPQYEKPGDVNRLILDFLQSDRDEVKPQVVQ